MEADWTCKTQVIFVCSFLFIYKQGKCMHCFPSTLQLHYFVRMKLNKPEDENKASL